jgi:hypothetical protein
MSAFISYSQKDGASFGALCYALKGEGVPYWDPKTMEAGGSLRDQLRNAISRCDVCIFLATHNSIESKWCLAEIGAFWGAGKRVVVFMVDSEIGGEKIPPQFQGDLWTPDVGEVIRAAKATINEADKRRRQESGRKSALVSEMTVEGLYEVLASLINRPGGSLPLTEIMRSIQEGFSSSPPDAEAVIRPLLSHLIGVPKDVVETSAQKHWPLSFVLETDSGKWLGYANSPISYSDINGYNNCLLLLCDDKSCIAATVVSSVWARPGLVDYGTIIVNYGKVDLGQPERLSP